MDWIPTLVPYRQTGYFSRIITDYLNKAEPLSPFIRTPSPPKAFRLPWKPGNPSPSTGKCWSGLWKINIRTSLQRRWSHKTSCAWEKKKLLPSVRPISRPFSPAISILFIRSCTPSGWPIPLRTSIHNTSSCPSFIWVAKTRTWTNWGHIYLGNEKLVWDTKQKGAVEG